MPTTTTNHGLTKPAGTDNVDISVLNTNFDKIDAMPVLYSQSAEPTNKVSGKTLWYDTANSILRLWNGSSWESLGGGVSDVMLTDAEFESNLSDSVWCEKLASARFMLSMLLSGAHKSYWWGKIVTAQVAMEKIAASTLAMDGVSNDSDIRGWIWNSSTAWDEVASVSMAIAKYLVGEIGGTTADFSSMSEVAGDSTVMAAIAASSVYMEKLLASSLAFQAVLDDSVGMSELCDSSTAMDKVLGTVSFRSLFLLNSYLMTYFWNNANSSVLWEHGSPTPPYTYASGSNGTLEGVIVDGPTSGGKAFCFRQNSGCQFGNFDYSFTLDLTDVSEFKIKLKHERYYTGNYMRLYINGSMVYSSNSVFDWTDMTFDVSGITGEVTILFRCYNQNGSTSTSWYHRAYYGDLRLA